MFNVTGDRCVLVVVVVGLFDVFFEFGGGDILYFVWWVLVIIYFFVHVSANVLVSIVVRNR